MRQKLAVLSSLFALIAVAVAIALAPQPALTARHGVGGPPDVAVLEAVLIDLLTRQSTFDGWRG